MNSFSISELQSYSGIKAHTIRIWEQRYNALKPMRSKGNTRSYDHLQLRRLLNIVSLMNTDFKVSDLCMMSDKELNILLDKHIHEQASENAKFDALTTQLISSALTYDEALFEKIFSTCILRYGLKESYLNILYPMLVRIGLMWTKDTLPPAQEHFITHLVRQKILSAVDWLPAPNEDSDSWLLFLPENEWHETGLLFAHYLIRQAGQKVIYLGANVPFDSVNLVVQHTEPTHVLFFLVHNDDPEMVQAYLKKLEQSFKKQNLLLSGNENLIANLKLGKASTWLQSVEQLESKLFPKKSK